MSRYVDVQIGTARGRIELLEEQAPQTCQAFWDALPIEDRTVPVRWSGNAWRSDGNFELSFMGIDNRADWLQAGDLAYYPRQKKVCFAYGRAQWRMPNGDLIDINHIGRVVEGLDALVEASERAHTEGAAVYKLTRG